MCRKCGERDLRGSSRDRRARRRALLAGRGAASLGGNGVLTACVWCECLLGDRAGYLTIPAGAHGPARRIPVARLEQDRLIRNAYYSLAWNVVPSCGPCNRARDEAQLPGGIPVGCSDFEWHGPNYAAGQLAALIADNERARVVA